MTSAPYNPFVSDAQRMAQQTPVVMLGPPDGTAPRYLAGEFTASSSANTITLGQSVDAGDALQVRSSGTLPGGLAEGRVVYARSSGTTVEVSESPSGSAVDITDVGTGTHRWSRQGDQASFLRPRRLVRRSGGRRLDAIDFDFVLAEAGLRIENLQTPTNYARQVEVRLLDENGEPTIPLAWGDLTRQQLRLGRTTRQETVRVRAEIRPYHFGDVLLGTNVWDPLTSTEAIVERDPVFNPEVDGKKFANMSDRAEHDSYPARLFLEPQAIRGPSAKLYQDVTPQDWTLARAVEWVCLTLNPSETFIRNPAVDETQLGFSPDLENVRLRRGRYLPAYLDALLIPHGFAWCIDLDLDDGRMLRTIRIYRVGSGVEKSFHWLPVGSEFEGTLDQDTARFDVTTNVADAVNAMTGDGELEVREVTIELYRGWPETDDAADLGSIADADKTWKWWPANLDGNYIYQFDGSRMRETTKPIPTSPPDLSSVFSLWVPRERAWGRPLTLGDDGFRYPDPVVEYSLDDGSTWLPWDPELLPGWKLRTDEATLVFADVPTLLYSVGSNARVRITGTLVGDSRLTANATRGDDSPNLRTNELVLDLDDRFADRSVDSGSWSKHDSSGEQSAFGSRLYAEIGVADERDDASALQGYVDRHLANEESAAMQGGANLLGLVTGYAIGDLITGLVGRDVCLNRNAPNAETEKYLQVTGLEYDVQKRRTRPITEPTEAPVS